MGLHVYKRFVIAVWIDIYLFFRLFYQLVSNLFLHMRLTLRILIFKELSPRLPFLPFNQLLDILVLVFLWFGLILDVIDGYSLFLLLPHIDLS